MESYLRFEHITKQYPGVTALNDVSLSFRQGEVHALMGQWGGKIHLDQDALWSGAAYRRVYLV